MITEVTSFKNLNQKYKDVLNQELNPEQMVYLVKDNNMNVKTITTSILQAIAKTQVVN